MATTDQDYPDYLNPFGSDNEQEGETSTRPRVTQRRTKIDEYPEYLSPFVDEDQPNGDSYATNAYDTYDDSLNPFGDEEDDQTQELVQMSIAKRTSPLPNDGNPFDEDDGDEVLDTHQVNVNDNSLAKDASSNENISSKHNETPNRSPTPKLASKQPESLEPPVPLPRTKSLLKKEQRNKQLQQQQQQKPANVDTSQSTSILSVTSSHSSSSLATSVPVTVAPREKKKRNAPPVPINFKRQVSGSLEEIEAELNDIGDKLAIIERESNTCQESLKATHQVDEVEFVRSRSEFIELIKRKNSIVRRQKELMYRKRELKLDQIYSDIEYELRMIGNKQLSHRTAEDESREKELLRKLVEIVEEKNDIVENLNRDTFCDNQEIEEAFRRLSIECPAENSGSTEDSKKDASGLKKKKNDSVNRGNLIVGNKLSKIATLLPKSGTLKGTIKMKHKRLFKKSETPQIER